LGPRTFALISPLALAAMPDSVSPNVSTAASKQWIVPAIQGVVARRYTAGMADGTLTKSAGVTAEGWLTDCWYYACASKTLGKGRQCRRMILGQPVMLARTEKGEAFALRDICPHRLVPLSAGKQVDTRGEPTIQCPYHGWRFGTDGGCRHMPSLVNEG